MDDLGIIVFCRWLRNNLLYLTELSKYGKTLQKITITHTNNDKDSIPSDNGRSLNIPVIAYM